MFDFIQAAIQPIIVDYLVWILVPIIAWPLRLRPKRWKLETEIIDQGSLHRAADTAVGLILDTIQRHPGIAIADAAITRGIGTSPDRCRMRSSASARRKPRWRPCCDPRSRRGWTIWQGGTG